MDRLPLEGIRIIDFSWVMAIPTCTTQLAHLGAEVIKVESRRRLDQVRSTAPFDGTVHIDRSGRFHTHNLSKKSCTLDLSRPEGITLVKELVRISDVVTENYAARVMNRLGLGYEALHTIRPDVIMLASAGLGHSGPEQDYGAYGIVINAGSGLGYVTGYEGGGPGTVDPYLSDYTTGMYAAFAVCAALEYRARTGEGQYIDLSMIEAQASLLAEPLMDYSMNARVQGRRGNKDDVYAPHNCYPCAGHDNWVAVAVTNDQEWRALCAAMERPDLATDSRFADDVVRVQHQGEIDPIIAAWTRPQTHEAVAQRLQAAGVPAYASLKVDELVADPQLNARGFWVTPEHPLSGKRVHPGLPWKLGGLEDGALRYDPAPLLGQDNAYVFHDLLGLSAEEVERLTADGVIN